MIVLTNMFLLLKLEVHHISYDGYGRKYQEWDNNETERITYTYDEFVEVCKALTKDKDGDGEIDQWGCGFANAFMFYQFVWGNGASFCADDYKTVTVTDPKFEEALQKFVDEMSNWYVRRCRERYWVQEMTDDKINAYLTLYTALVTTAKAAAPMIPFMAEDINLIRQINNIIIL